jgi:flagellar hook-basal body complex protein FliE
MREISFDPKIAGATAIGTATGTTAPAGAVGGDFSAVLKAALDGVNSTQADAEKLARAFQTGEAQVGLEETMVAIAKANVEFQTLVQTRNRLVQAYHEIMNMQV